MLIALGHQSNVGKNTAADLLATYIRTNTGKSVKVTSFAYTLKYLTWVLYENCGVHRPEHYEKHREDKKIILDKLNCDVVDLWIKIGNFMREVHPDTWIDKAISRADLVDVLIITDLRFTNEFTKIKESDGCCVKIVSDRAELRDSDNEIGPDCTWDYVVSNDGTKADLYEAMKYIWEQINDSTSTSH